jgi:hypothetical protein
MDPEKEYDEKYHVDDAASSNAKKPLKYSKIIPRKK